MKKIIMPKLPGSMIVMLFLLTSVASGLERGSILYHSSKEDKIYGRDAELILPDSIGQIAFREMKSGHVGLYIGVENGKHKIIHAILAGVEETESSNFITQKDVDEGCKFIGAKVPANYASWTQEQKDQLILVAKEQVGARYDVQFRHQKGPYDDKFTCVGLIEYIYEQAGYNITPDGYYSGGAGGITYIQTYNSESTFWRDWFGENTFSQTVEFSKFEHPLASALNVGLIHDGGRYMFFPYTQYLQTTTTPIATDIPVSGGSGKDNDDDKGGCFIATAAYGSYLHPHVRILRALRDRFLLTNKPGRLFVEAYYHYSPPLADFISRHDALKAAVRVILLPLLGLSLLMLWMGPVFILAMSAFMVLLFGALRLRKAAAA
ncbi:MAG: hypothetical protein JW943_10740 [Deltaproteobacteria bacterium]|nr:hypothetical protein [Deltaproteobacteria bacterium]